MEKFKIKDETKGKIISIIKFIIVAFILSVFCCQPYLNNMLIYSHDLGYHLNRIIQISKNLDLGIFPSFIHAGLLRNLGYANSIFYPEIFLYIPAILMSLFKLHVLTVYKIFLIIITFFTFISMYISTKGIFKKKEVAYVASLLYVFSLYRLSDIYVRGAIGEILSMIFIPVVIYGLYEIIFGENKKWWIVSIGLFGMANSHLLSFVMILPLIILFCLINIDKIFKDRKKLLNLFLGAILAVILCIGFFGPVLEQRLNDEFYFDGQSLEDPSIIKDRALSLSMAFGSELKAGYALNSSIDNGGMSEGIGGILIIFALLIFLRKGLNYKENRFEIQIFTMGLILFLITTKLFPWEKFEFLSILQFPFRLNIFTTIFFVFVGANSFYEIVTNKKDSCVIISLVILIIAGYVLSNVVLNFNPYIYKTDKDLIAGVEHEVGYGEYLPAKSNIDDLKLYNINDQENTYKFTQTRFKNRI